MSSHAHCETPASGCWVWALRDTPDACKCTCAPCTLTRTDRAARTLAEEAARTARAALAIIHGSPRLKNHDTDPP